MSLNKGHRTAGPNRLASRRSIFYTESHFNWGIYELGIFLNIPSSTGYARTSALGVRLSRVSQSFPALRPRSRN